MSQLKNSLFIFFELNNKFHYFFSLSLIKINYNIFTQNKRTLKIEKLLTCIRTKQEKTKKEALRWQN